MSMLLVATLLAAGPQSPAIEALADRLPPHTPEPARAAWTRFLTSTYGERPGPAVDALRLEVEVLQRGESTTNEVRLTLTFQEPHFVHVHMASGREQARGPAEGGRTRDWFREDGRVVEMVGREYATDRQELGRLVTLCRNFLALANPGRLEVSGVELARAPRGTPDGRIARRLEWLRFESPDFHLPGAAPDFGTEQAPRYEVHLGLDPETGAVHRAEVAPADEGADLRRAVYLAFDRHRDLSGLSVPEAIRLYHVAEVNAFGPVFQGRAAVEIWVRSGELGLELGAEDFLP